MTTVHTSSSFSSLSAGRTAQKNQAGQLKLTAAELKDLGKTSVVANHEGELFSIEPSHQGIRYAKKTASAFVDILKNSTGVKIGLGLLATAAALAIITSSFGVGVLAVPVLVGALNALGIFGGLSIAGGLAWTGGQHALNKNSKLRNLSDMGAKFDLSPKKIDDLTNAQLTEIGQHLKKEDLIKFAEQLIHDKPDKFVESEQNNFPFTTLTQRKDALLTNNEDETAIERQKNELLNAIVAARKAT